jgi:hypothetical protein
MPSSTGCDSFSPVLEEEQEEDRSAKHYYVAEWKALLTMLAPALFSPQPLLESMGVRVHTSHTAQVK